MLELGLPAVIVNDNGFRNYNQARIEHWEQVATTLNCVPYGFVDQGGFAFSAFLVDAQVGAYVFFPAQFKELVRFCDAAVSFALRFLVFRGCNASQCKVMKGE